MFRTARTARTFLIAPLALLTLAAAACGSDGGNADGDDRDVASTTTTIALGPTGGVPAPDVPIPANPLWTGDTKPDPVPPENVVLSLPKDMYRHDGAPTEWWWHIGTLRAGDREFGFEINAASFAGQGFAMTQVSLSDVSNERHLERTQVYIPGPGNFDVATWAEGDPSKDWYARLGDPSWQVGSLTVTSPGSGYTSAPEVQFDGDGTGAAALAVLDADGGVGQIALLNPGTGYTTPPTVTLTGGGGSGAEAVAVRSYVAMEAPQADPSKDIRVKSLMVDDPTLTEVEFDLTFSQEGRPFFVFGTGIEPSATEQSLETDNYYFSFTRLAAKGTITIDGEEFEVSGTTWMDHEYGYFGGGDSSDRVRWLLQDMQLDNGYSISNAGIIGEGYQPEIGVTVDSYATIQDDEGHLYYVASKVTPVGELWTSPTSGNGYAQQFRVEIPSFGADITVTTKLQDQEFALPTASIYEGIARAEGTLLDKKVTGDSWIEQAF
jgi:predicted secreted hydrolase